MVWFLNVVLGLEEEALALGNLDSLDHHEDLDDPDDPDDLDDLGDPESLSKGSLRLWYISEEAKRIQPMATATHTRRLAIFSEEARSLAGGSPRGAGCR